MKIRRGHQAETSSPPGRIVLVALPVILAILITIATTLTLRFEQATATRLEMIGAEGRDTFTWSTYQLALELGRLVEAARDTLQGRIDDQALRLRFDLFVSAVHTIETGSFRSNVAGEPYYIDATRELDLFIGRVDASLSGRQDLGTTAEALIDNARTIEPLLRRLAYGTTQANQQAIGVDREALRNLRIRLGEAVTAQGILIAFFAAVLAWSLRRQMATARELRVTNQRLERERERFIDAIETIPDGFVIFDPDDRLVICNERYREIYALSAPFIQPGARAIDIMREGARLGQYPQAGDDIEGFIQKMVAWRHSDGTPIERLLPDGRWFRVALRRTRDGGTVSIRTDITALKKAKERAETSERAMSEFLAVMSHEIRTPLNGVLGMLGLIDCEKLLPEDRRCVAAAQSAGQHLLAIVNDILDLTKLDAGKLEVESAPFSPAELIRQVIAVVTPKASEGCNTIIATGIEDLPPWLAGDSMRLRQILLNLVGNAAKFTREGRIEIAVRTSSREGRVMLDVDVIDSGIGIPPEMREKLFDKFAQGDSSITRRFGGTGLGLSICKRLVELQGGVIGVESSPGAGSRFWFRLPLTISEPPPSQSAKPLDQRRCLNILVAEDNSINREVIEALLQSAGYRCVVVDNGRAAIEALTRARYDMVLMDVQMPFLDGLSATREIRAMKDDVATIPIVALTADAFADHLKRCIDAGMDEHLTKPIDSDQLFATIDRIGKKASSNLR